MKKVLLIALAIVSLSAFGNMTTKLVVNNPVCHGESTGSIELYVFGGTAPLTYTWDNGLPSGSAHHNLAAGTYSFTVTDFTGDVVSGSVIVAQPADISVTPNIIDASSPGANDGSIGLTVTGGTPIYAFSWSNDVYDRNISGLTAGTYTVDITDEAGCSKTFQFIVKEPNGYIAEKPQDKFIASKGKFHDGDNNLAKGAAPTGVEDVKNSPTLVYPNPATNLFNISLQPGTNTQIALITPNGQVVAQQNTDNNQTQLNVSDLPNGNYILSIRNEYGMTNKLVSVLK